MEKPKVAVVGLGYVGLPLAVAFGKSSYAPITGFDINGPRICELAVGHDSTGEVTDKDLARADIGFTNDPTMLRAASFVIVAVPTPITKAKDPDLTSVRNASRIVGRNLQRGAIVVFESTVYPGVTEEICAPIIERESGLKRGEDWWIGYSPERINPGDREHTLERVVKVVSAENECVLEAIATVYGEVCTAGVHRAPTIRTAEAAKVIENTQRDLNIALMNELSLIFSRIGVDTNAVLEAAGSKWNFHRYTPGLVGGHCIGVDPYYLTHLAESVGFHPQVILAGRRTNDEMGFVVAEQTIRACMQRGLRGDTATVLGMTFKPNIRDTRNSRVVDVIVRLCDYRFVVTAYDPMLGNDVPDFGQQKTAKRWEDLTPADALLLLVPHEDILSRIAADPGGFYRLINRDGVLFDLNGFTDRSEAERRGIQYLRL
jgi:UDP-N-acetyl-D-galactosamine dehydrogenase